MFSILVREGKNCKIAGLLKAGFSQFNGLSKIQSKETPDVFYDIEVFAPLEGDHIKDYRVKSRTTVIFGEDSAAFSEMAPDSYVITYGLSSRDTLTYSSNDDGVMVVCVQREFMTLEGKKVIQQERPFKTIEQKSELEQLAAYTCLLLCGI